VRLFWKVVLTERHRFDKIVAMNKKRLLKLADYLETVPRKRFNMDHWASAKFCGKPKEPEHECGTSACALGWACTIPSFKRAGLKFIECGSNFWTHIDLVPDFEGSTGYGAAASLFGIRYSQAEWLFSPESPARTPKQVAKRIRKFVESDGKIA
jgi:hypothetical protein